VTDISRLEEFLGRRYEFRYNEMTDTTEYRPRLSFQYQFMQQSPLKQVFRTYVLPVAEHEEGEWKTCTEIFHYLQRKSRDKFSNSQLSPLGRIANKYCTVTKKSGRGMLYWVKMG
jgi:hypothetical protein